MRSDNRGDEKRGLFQERLYLWFRYAAEQSEETRREVEFVSKQHLIILGEETRRGETFGYQVCYHTCIENIA